MKEKIPWSCILAIMAILAASFGAYQHLERYALAEDLKKVEQRLDYKIISDQLEYKQQKMEQIEDRYKSVEKAPEVIQKDYKRLREEKNRLEKKLDALEKK